MRSYQPPKYYKKDKFTVFLGGSIDMGKCENWQKKIIEDLENEDIIILNPRGDTFDNTQQQTADNQYFSTQVNWELDGLMNCDLIIMYLLPGTKSPISLMEIGLYTDISVYPNNKIIICCPDGFWRKGNIEIVCRRYGIKLLHDYQSLVDEIKKRIYYNNI